MTERTFPKPLEALGQAFGELRPAGADVQPPLPGPTLAALFDHLCAKIEEEGCDFTLRYSKAFLGEHTLDVDAVVVWLRESGGYCDCEVLANVPKGSEAPR